MTLPTFQKLTRTTLIYNLAVILWGAYVRASGSGAGCGNHWPLCNGEVVPRAPRLETLIELSHRLTSGLALLAGLAVLVFAWKLFPAGHRVRSGAFWSFLLLLAEGGVGAALVLFRLVAENESIARAGFMAAHLLVTFVLLAALTLTDLWARGAPELGWRQAPRPLRRQLVWVASSLMLVGASGAVAALGDTLYPASSLAQGLAQDLSPTASLFVKLRLIHPFLAAAVGLYLLFAVRPTGPRRAARSAPALAVHWLVLGQLALGTLNVGLLAPIPLQLGHLLLADLLWVATIALGAERLATARERTAASKSLAAQAAR
ncbi:MAG: COX15/CtaA family protein [Thermoanaerobaculia bacterium]